MLQMKQVCKRVSAVPLMALVAAAAHAYFWVIPPAYENTNVGDGLNTIVRNAGNPRTYQMIVHASQLTGIAVGDQIVGITFRLYNGAAGSWPSADVTWSDYEVYIGESVDPASMSTTFADNWIGSPVQVMDGPFTIPAGSFGWTSTNPKPWATVEWTFSTPFTYTGGHLGILFTHPGSDSAEVQFLDALSTTRPGYGVDYRAASATGFQMPSGAFTSFTIGRLNVVPEPATLLTLATGLSLIALRRRKR